MKNKIICKSMWCLLMLIVFSTFGVSVNSYAVNRTEVSRLSCGDNHSLYLSSDGTVLAWGANDKGQLGDNTTTNRKAPVQVSGLNSVIAVSGGGSHSLALKSDGFVWAWGLNDDGQLGNGTSTTSKKPVRVTTVPNVIAIAAGESHSLALRADGTVWAWGSNVKGQLGDGTNTKSNVPVQVKDLTKVIAIAAGESHSLALESDGTIMAWGLNVNGQLGDGTNNNSNIPVPVASFDKVVEIACGGSFSFAVRTDSTVWAWGSNSDGQLGLGNTNVGPKTPTKITGLTGIVDIDGGSDHSIAVKADGTVYAWGANASGQLGNGTTKPKTSPTKITSLKLMVAVAAGGASHSLALGADDTVKSWGSNASGQLGNNSTKNSSKPVSVQGLSGIITAFDAGRFHSLFVKADGTVWASGYNAFGQLGNWSLINDSSPVKVSGLSKVMNVAGGWWFSLALKTDGTVWGWGYNGDGELGNGSTTDGRVPVQVSGLSNVKQIDAGAWHALALKKDGTVWAWGYNGDGQLGDGTNIDKLTPVQVSGLTGVMAIACGSFHSLAIKNDGTVWAWGWNSNGQIGDGTIIGKNTPVQVSLISGAIGIAGGDFHSLAVKNDGTVSTWGRNDEGQLGVNDLTDRLAPVSLTTFNSATDVAAGAEHSMVRTSEGNIWTSGHNAEGELGDGTNTRRQAFVLAGGTGFTDVKTISSGGYHCIVFRKNGTLWAWGYDADSEVGDGLSYDKWSPIQVLGLSYACRAEAGYASSYTLRSDGTVWGWGYNGYGQLGDTTGGDRYTPIRTGIYNNAIDAAGSLNNIFKDMVAVSSFGTDEGGAGLFAIFLKADGTVWSVGRNTEGQLGDTSTVNKSTPVQVGVVFNNVVAIAAGGYHALALKSDGTVWGWGWNGDGELGDGTVVTPRTLPQRVGGGVNFKDVIAIAAGPRHSLFLKSDGTVWACGLNERGQLGDGTRNPETTPIMVNGLNDVRAITAGGRHSLAIKSDGLAFGWGSDDWGQLATGSTGDKLSATPVMGGVFSNIVYIAASNYGSFFVQANGALWSTGRNYEGELGDGQNYPSRLTIVRVKGFNGATSVACGPYHAVGGKSTGRLRAWGQGYNGRLGDGRSYPGTNVPGPVNGF